MGFTCPHRRANDCTIAEFLIGKILSNVQAVGK